MLIDFSVPAALSSRLADCRTRKIPVVVGTTGLTAEHHTAIDSAAKEIAVVQSPNMSVGVNLLFKLAGEVARSLGEDYDIEIIEGHHRFKADAPSGTALGLAESICAATERDMKKDFVHGREGQVGARTKREIGMHAFRAGDTVGDHTVIFGALGERVELRHVASTRDTFVRGAASRGQVARRPACRTLHNAERAGSVVNPWGSAVGRPAEAFPAARSKKIGEIRSVTSRNRLVQFPWTKGFAKGHLPNKPLSDPDSGSGAGGRGGRGYNAPKPHSGPRLPVVGLPPKPALYQRAQELAAFGNCPTSPPRWTSTTVGTCGRGPATPT